MERYKLNRMTLRSDQATRLYGYGFKIKGMNNRTVQMDFRQLDMTPLFDVWLPESAVILQHPEFCCGGQPGIARIQPTEADGFYWELRWRPAIDGGSGRVTGFRRLDIFYRKPDKPKKLKGDQECLL